MRQQRHHQRGFTLVELAALIVIIGSLAAFSTPKFLSSVERSRAAEAYEYLTQLHAAQERYHARHGTYAGAVEYLDIKPEALKYFTTTGVNADGPQMLRATWSMMLTRTGASSGFGAYTVVFDQDGFDAKRSTISEHPALHQVTRRAQQRLQAEGSRPVRFATHR